MIRMIELFAGIGAQASAMKRLGIDRCPGDPEYIKRRHFEFSW